MAEIRTVGIIGMGALGILYGDLIGQALGYDKVRFIGDEARVKRFRESEGVFCNGRACPFEMVTADGAGRPDLLIFATKGTGLEAAAEEAKKAVTEDTVIVSLLNGITSEDVIREKLGSRHIVYSIAQGMDATRSGRTLSYAHPGVLCVGLPEGSDEALKQDLENLCAFLEKARIPFERDPDVIHRMWAKWMLNVGVNQLCMVNEGGYGIVQKPGLPRERMIAAMNEAKAVAQASGVRVTDEDRDFYVALIDSLAPEGMPSMRQDGLAGRRTEVEFFAGTVVKKGHALGIAVPVNEALYQEIKTKEAAFPKH